MVPVLRLSHSLPALFRNLSAFCDALGVEASRTHLLCPPPFHSLYSADYVVPFSASLLLAVYILEHLQASPPPSLLVPAPHRWCTGAAGAACADGARRGAVGSRVQSADGGAREAPAHRRARSADLQFP